MKSQAILCADYLDILFDNRNKNYGGYDLRKTYQQRVKKALTIVMLTTVTAIAYPVIASNFGEHKVIADVLHGPVVITDLQPPIEKPPVELPKPQQAAAPVETQIFTIPDVVVDDQVRDKDLLKENDKITNPGTADIIGDPVNDIVPIDHMSTGGGIIDVPAKTDEIVGVVEQMPEYNGDMYAFLQKHMNYPDIARESGIEGKVIVRFVVNEDGSIVNAKVVKGIGAGCDEEAIRVISSMPKWKPGKNNGKAVRVYFTLPVVFRLD